MARTDDGSRTFTASSAGELRALVEADYQAHPVPRRDTHQGRAAMDRAQAQALKDLDVHRGEFYAITLGSHGWMARRRDNGHFLVAATPDDLEELIDADCEAEASATRLDDRQAVVAGSAIELQKKIQADYRARPVDRSAAPDVD